MISPPRSPHLPPRPGVPTAPEAITEPDASAVDHWAAIVADRLLPAATIGLCLLMFACWAPHYLGWPWWPDLDTFAAAAVCWAEGIRPYQDFAGYSFPGPIYLFSVLNAVFGAGTTWPIYALDAAMVAGLGVALAAWSRRRLGRWWPGLVGASALLARYADLNFSLVAQRDWQATCLVVLALLAPTTWPGRRGRLASALATAAALTFRPHVVLFGPALLLAIVEGERASGDRRRPARVVLEWMLVAGAAAALMFAPLIAQGLLDDLIRNLRLATYGSHYSRATPSGMVAEVVRQVTAIGWIAVPVAVAMLAGTSGGAIRREARIWLAASACVLLYKPLHPRPHDYLDQPRWVVWSVTLALLAAIVSASPTMIRSGRLRLAASLAILAAAVPAKPDFCNPGSALAALRSIVAGDLAGDPGRTPPGYRHHMSLYDLELYPWDDYRSAIAYLRDEVPASTSVANLMGYQLAAVGASGRLPTFRNESGLLWKSQVGMDESAFVARLEAEPDSVVLWTPTAEGPEPGLVSPGLVAAVERLYEPAERFGVIEVWRRKRSGSAQGPASSDRIASVETGAITPRSVTMPVMSAAGVTSKAGL